eukprot:3444517-Heterocapsa_arctica.AAC.1
MRRFMAGKSFETDSVKSSKHRALGSLLARAPLLKCESSYFAPSTAAARTTECRVLSAEEGVQIRSHKYCMTRAV